MTDLDQNGIALLILRWGATRARVLPVDIQTIKLILTQERDHAADEGLTIGRRRNHSCEPIETGRRSEFYLCYKFLLVRACSSFYYDLLLSTKVPSSDGQQCLQVAVPASSNNIHFNLSNLISVHAC